MEIGFIRVQNWLFATKRSRARRTQQAIAPRQSPVYGRLTSPAPHVYGRSQARAKAQSRARLASHRNIPRSASLDGASSARATLRPAHERFPSLAIQITIDFHLKIYTIA